MFSSSWGLGARNLSGFHWGLVWGLEFDTQGLAFTQGEKRQWERASPKVCKSERDTQRERELKDRGRGRVGEAEREGKRLCSKFPWVFSRIPQF